MSSAPPRRESVADVGRCDSCGRWGAVRELETPDDDFLASIGFSPKLRREVRVCAACEL